MCWDAAPCRFGNAQVTLLRQDTHIRRMWLREYTFKLKLWMKLMVGSVDRLKIWSQYMHTLAILAHERQNKTDWANTLTLTLLILVGDYMSWNKHSHSNVAKIGRERYLLIMRTCLEGHSDILAPQRHALSNKIWRIYRSQRHALLVCVLQAHTCLL